MVDKTKFDGGRAVMVKKDGASFADDFVPMDVHMYTWTPRPKVVDANDLHLLARLPTEGWLLYCLYIRIYVYIYILI